MEKFGVALILILILSGCSQQNIRTNRFIDNCASLVDELTVPEETEEMVQVRRDGAKYLLKIKNKNNKYKLIIVNTVFRSIMTEYTRLFFRIEYEDEMGFYFGEYAIKSVINDYKTLYMMEFNEYERE